MPADCLLTSWLGWLKTVNQATFPYTLQHNSKSGAWRLPCSFLFAIWHLANCAACFLTVQLPVLFRGQSDVYPYQAWQLNLHDPFSTPVGRLAWSASCYGSDTGKSGKSFRCNCLLWCSPAVLPLWLNFPEYQTPWLLIFLCCIVRNYCPEHGNLLVSGSQWEMMKLTNRFLSYSIPDYPAFLSAIGRQRFIQTPNWLWVWHKKEVCSGKKSQPCFAIHSSARLRLRFWRWAVNHRPSASCTIHAFNIASGFSFNIWPFRCFSNSKNVQHIHLCLEPKLMMQIYTAYPYAPNFFTCIYQQLLNTSYQQDNTLKIRYAILKLLISTNKDIYHAT